MFFILDPARPHGVGCQLSRGWSSLHQQQLPKELKAPVPVLCGDYLGTVVFCSRQSLLRRSKLIRFECGISLSSAQVAGAGKEWPLPVPCHTQVQPHQLLILLWGERCVWSELASPDRYLGPALPLTTAEGGQAGGSFPVPPLRLCLPVPHPSLCHSVHQHIAMH